MVKLPRLGLLQGEATQWSALLLPLLTLLAFIPLKSVLVLGAGHASEFRVWALLVICIGAASFSFIRTSETSKAICIVVRGIFLLFTLYLVLSSGATPSHDNSGSLLAEEIVYRWVAITWGVVAWWRVSWGIPLLVAIRWKKAYSSELLGYQISVTDYLPLVEIGILLIVGSLLYGVWTRLSGELERGGGEVTGPSLNALLLTALAVHFANYLYSGLQKLWIGETLWQWLVDNQTYYLTLAAWEAGTLPLTAIGREMAMAVLHWQVLANVPLNVLTLLLQLSAIVAIVKPRMAMMLTMLYDLMHVAIFLVTGILFYKWIWLNVLFILGLGTLKEARIQGPVALWLIAVMLGAPNLFFVAFLGWFDTPSFNDEYIEASTNEGKVYRVPSNYFLSGSVTYAQQRVLREKPGHFATDAFGSVYGEGLSQGQIAPHLNCELLSEVGDRGSGSASKLRVRAQLIKHHAHMLDLVDETGRYEYDFYPHHIFSMPWKYKEFHELDKRQIAMYRYVVESKCLGYTPEGPIATTLLRRTYEFPIAAN